MPVVMAPIALKRGLRVGERRAPNRPAQRRPGLCVPGRGSEAGVQTHLSEPGRSGCGERPRLRWGGGPLSWGPAAFTRGVRIAQRPLAQDLFRVITACVLAVLRLAASFGWARSTAIPRAS